MNDPEGGDPRDGTGADAGAPLGPRRARRLAAEGNAHAGGRAQRAQRAPARPRRRRRRAAPRWLVATWLLGLVGAAGATAGAALAGEAEGEVPDAIGAPAPATPVLSLRRVPELLAAPVADRRLAQALDPLVAQQPGTVCLTVASSGRSVYEHEPSAALVPASVQKLLTAVAALEVLGPDFRYRTRVVAEAAPGPDGVVAGDVWLIGSGDPLLAEAAYAARFRNQPQLRTPVEALADAVAGAGITAIAGRLLGDESRYDTDRYPDPWPARFAEQDQSGPLSALTVNDAWSAYPPTSEVSTPDETPADDPAAFAAGVVAGLLGQRGVSISGGVASGTAPAGAVELAVVESAPLAEVLGEMLAESDNQTGELVLKELAVARGRPGTTADGAAVVAEVVAGLGLPVVGTATVDGSGLAGANRETCALVQAILDRVGPDSPIGQGLAVAGESGTLARRFLESPVRGRLVAKTGTLNAATALAGYLPTAAGARVSFAFLANLVAPADVENQRTAQVTADMLGLQEDIAEALDRYPEGPPLAALEPLPAGS